MSLVRCRSCKAVIDHAAKTCAKCGKRRPASLAIKLFRLMLVLVVLGGLSVGGYLGFEHYRHPHPPLSKGEEKLAADRAREEKYGAPIDITSDSLELTYEANEIAGDQKFGRHQLRIDGKIALIEKTDSGEGDQIVVIYFVAAGACPACSVACMFTGGADVSIISVLTRGQRVVLGGIGNGYAALRAASPKRPIVIGCKVEASL